MIEQPASRPDSSVDQPGTLRSTRDRLLHVFADLTTHGIAAYPALGTDVEGTRNAIRRAILARFPHAIGSYIFWSVPGDAAFDANGELVQALTLHHSGQDVARAVCWKLHEAGVIVEGAQDQLSLQVPVGQRALPDRSAARALA